MEQCAKILGRELPELEAELSESREKLFQARAHRIRPGRDDKIIVSWNGLMIDAMARAGASLHEPEYVITAAEAAGFILSRMRRDDGRLLHTWRHGKAKLDAYLDDYTSLANALVSLYEANFHERWVEAAVQVLDIVLDKFSDPSSGGFFYTANDHEQLITRTKELTDSSTPSGNALAVMALLRMGKLLGRSDYLDAAESALAAASPVLQRAPLAAGQSLLALDQYLGPSAELVLVGDLARDDTKDAIAAIHRRYLPRSVIAVRDSRPSDANASRSGQLDKLFAGKESTDGRPVLYVCENFACNAPAVGLEAIEEALTAIR
jgi:uncharacterized protein YyaL (SSP411 family)